jgi:hypothetical protein
VHTEAVGTMQTPDGSWQVDIVRGAADLSYRVVHHDNVIDWLSLTDVEDLFHSAGIDMSDRVDAPPQRDDPLRREHGSTLSAGTRRPMRPLGSTFDFG